EVAGAGRPAGGPEGRPLCARANARSIGLSEPAAKTLLRRARSGNPRSHRGVRVPRPRVRGAGLQAGGGPQGRWISPAREPTINRAFRTLRSCTHEVERGEETTKPARVSGLRPS